MRIKRTNDLKAKKQLEEILLYLIIELVSTSDVSEISEITIELSQKEKDAQIMIMKDNFTLSAHAVEELNKMRSGFEGSVHIASDSSGTKVSIKMPMLFRSPESPVLEVKDIKTIEVKKPNTVSVG